MVDCAWYDDKVVDAQSRRRGLSTSSIGRPLRVVEWADRRAAESAGAKGRGSEISRSDADKHVATATTDGLFPPRQNRIRARDQTRHARSAYDGRTTRRDSVSGGDTLEQQTNTTQTAEASVDTRLATRS